MIPAVFMLLLNCIDIGLYRFAGKRITADVLSIMNHGEDIANTVPSMITDFWYLLLILVVLIYFLFLAYNRISLKSDRIGLNPHKPKGWLRQISLHILFLALIFIGFRGGIQYKPINILTASKYGTGPYASLVLNSPFTFVKTYGKNSLQEQSYYSKTDLDKIYSPIINKVDSLEFRPYNVVLIILESIGKEYIGRLNSGKGYTPFLDSLIDQSLVFPNSFANGKRSIEGIPAIVAGIPALMSEPFITSAYSGNSFNSLASLLKKKGYFTTFYHGGTNGTMGFDNFSRSSGFEQYFGRKEYAGDEDFDGTWGIYDEPFMLRFVDNMNKVKKPFFATVFTLSSHHPYNIPKVFDEKFLAGTLPIHKSVQYTDHALKSFFDYAGKQDWYQNTLFVITTDHTALSERSKFQSRVGMYCIPQLFYRPDGSLKGVNEKVTQQIDVMPSILDYMHYDQTYFSFGNSVFDSSKTGFAVNFINDTYQYIEGNYSLVLDTLQENYLYNYTSDTLLKKNLILRDSVKANEMEKKMKAIIQVYNNSLIENKMTY